MEVSPTEKRIFLIRQLLRGLLFLALLIGLFLVFNKIFPEELRERWFGSIYDNTQLVIAVFVGSEILFGIIPPEVFMLWAFRTGHLGSYYLSIALLSIISYSAGAFNFFLGRRIKDTLLFTKIRRLWLRKSLLLFEKYGEYLVIVASVTPIPFSAIALLSGAGNLDPKKYLKYSLWRIVRFFVYAFILYQASI
ncbi:YqaA family protein [Lunatibacter salilacus]|uniref:YqaA family protein n=1 Tax=Lunatibacter salilacus TaxID=2483804 RepID=UPI00131B4748|nr:VTT domain-containing protein [Lunatibacter salilacus]